MGKIGEIEECKKCPYYYEPDYNCLGDCNFPWWNWTEEEAKLMKCQNN